MLATVPEQITPTDLFLVRRQLALTKKAAKIRSENEIEFYCPHEKQADFHAAALYHYRYARTGNRFGKSEMGAAEDVAFAIGYRPWIPEGNPLRTLGIPQHPTKGLIVTTDWDKSTEVFTSTEEGTNRGKLFKYIPKSRLLGHTKNHSGAIDSVRVLHISGGVSIIHLDTVKSFKQNPLGQESSVWDWIHYDEPVPEDMFKAQIRGTIDRGGKCWFTCTPLTEPWIDVMFIPDTEQQTKEDLGIIQNGDFWMMTGKTDDNPHNKPEDIERVMALYSEEERETRRSGTPKAYFGLVYGHEFQWDKHVRGSVIQPNPPHGWVSWEKPPADYTLRFAIDYHPHKPHHVLFIATSPHEYQYVYAEIFLSCLMVELVAEIRCVLQLGESTVPGLIDPLADTEDRVTGVTALDEVRRLGLPVVPATKDPYNGILKVKELLKSRDRNGNPILQVNPACRRFLMEISRGYIWDGETNKPVKDKDDAMENFYRLCLQGLRYIEPSASDYQRSTTFSDNISNVIIRPDEFATDFNTFEEQKPARSKAFASRYRK